MMKHSIKGHRTVTAVAIDPRAKPRDQKTRLRVIEDPSKIKEARSEFRQAFKKKNPREIPTNIYGRHEVIGWWLEKFGICACFMVEPLARGNEGRYWWSPFGTTPPERRCMYYPSREISFPFKGIKRGINGAFAVDSRGQVFFVFRLGRIRKEAFFKELCESFRLEIIHDGDKETEVLRVGALDSANFVARVSEFVLKSR